MTEEDKRSKGEGSPSAEGDEPSKADPEKASPPEGELPADAEGAEGEAAGQPGRPDDVREADEARSRPSSPWPSAHRSEPPPPVKVEPPPLLDTAPPEKKAWGKPLDRLDRAWTGIEARLCAYVLVAEVLTLVFWISMKALSSTGRGGPGLVYRSVVTAIVLGAIAHVASKRLLPDAGIKGSWGLSKSEMVTSAAVAVGLFLGSFWGDLGIGYFANYFAWLQNASILVFFGGVSELAKRFTLWLALLGASLATAQGKHINVDVVMRFLTPRARVPLALLGWLAAAVVSLTAAWGFFDNLAVEDFRAPTSVPCPGDESAMCTAPWQSKVKIVVDDTGRNLFLAGRQLSLDLRSFPKVVAGTPYGETMTAAEWNEWLRGGSWEKHFDREHIEAQILPEDGSIDYRNPAVTAIPGGTEPIRMLLVGLLNMVFPFGLFVIGIRFILRSLLALSGWVKVDPNAAHGDEELAHAHDHSPLADKVEEAIQETVR
jgi:hypothetical protein